MDQALKERSMGSAAARRRKMLEHEQEKIQRREAMSREERDRKVRELLDCSSNEESEEEPDSATSGTCSEPELDYSPSVQTPSEPSLLTPDDVPSPLVVRRKKPTLNLSGDGSPRVPAQLQIPHPDQQWTKHNFTIKPPPSPVPVLQSSLVTLSDWNYERFSAVFDPDEVQEMLAAEDLHEPYSPIEVATPILYSQPRMRPSVVSICSISSRKPRISVAERSSLSMQTMTLPSKPVTRTSHIAAQSISKPVRQFSSTSEPSAFPASEAIPFQMPNSPRHTAKMSSRAYVEIQVQAPPTPELSLKKKHSLPLLAAATRYSHMHTSSKADSTLSARSSATAPEHSRQSSGMSFLSSNFPSRRPQISSRETEPARTSMSLRSQTDPLSHRPTTSHSQASPWPQLPTDVPALPSSKPSALHIARKKSISALRSRSESIGQALKSVKARGRLSIRPDSSAPPIPALLTPRFDQPVDMKTFPLPPRSPLMTGRSSVASFSPFPPPASHGLGLRGM